MADAVHSKKLAFAVHAISLVVLIFTILLIVNVLLITMYAPMHDNLDNFCYPNSLGFDTDTTYVEILQAISLFPLGISCQYYDRSTKDFLAATMISDWRPTIMIVGLLILIVAVIWGNRRFIRVIKKKKVTYE